MKNRLHDLKLDEGASLPEFLNEIQDISNKLADVRDPVPNNQLVEIMLSSLPESYSTLVQTLLLLPAMPSITDLTGLLLLEEMRQSLLQSKRGNVEVHLAHTKRGRSHSHRSKSRSTDKAHKDKECNYCGELNHWMRNCPELTKELARRAEILQARKNNAVAANYFANSSGDDSDNEDAVELNALKFNLANLCHDWYVNSGTPQHVTGDSSQLTNVKSSKSHIIKTADGKGHQVQGVGIVSIPLHGGEIKEFTDILYVPGVTKNLFPVDSSPMQRSPT